MYDQLSKELKASLFQRIKSPFFGSFFISFILINYRFVFLMLSDKSIEVKFAMIDKGKLFSHIEPISFKLFSIDSIYLASFIYPFLFALFYIAIMPLFEYYISMPIWKYHQNRLKKKHAQIDNQEVFLGEEKSKYLNEILNIRKEKEKLIEDITNIDIGNDEKIKKAELKKDDYYKLEINKLNLDSELKLKNNIKENKENEEKIITLNKNLELEESKNNKLDKEINLLITKSKNIEKKYNLLLKTKDQLVEELEVLIEKLNNNEKLKIQKRKERKEEIEKLQNEVEIQMQEITIKYNKQEKELKIYKEKEKKENEFKDKKYEKYLNDYSNNEIRYFKTIYEYDITDGVTYANFINNLKIKLEIKRITIENITDKLIEKEFLKIRAGYLYYQKNLKELIDDMFNIEKMKIN